jgi:hypothetical protein
MGESKHTPGPWEVESGEAVYVLDKEYGRVCTVNWLRGPFGSFGRRTDAEGHANARLIAAAPDLLAALRALVAKSTDLHGDWSEEWRKALEAIAKAEGAQ